MTLQYLKPPPKWIHDPELALYLPLYKRDATGFMSSDHNGHLVTRAGALWTPQGHSFDGVDDVLTVPHCAVFNLTALTVIATFKVNSTPSNQTILDKNFETDTMTGYSMRVNDTTGMYFYLGDGVNYDTIVVSKMITIGDWYQFAVTFNAGNGDLYRNGISVGSLAMTPTSIAANTFDLTIGSRDGSVSPFDGVISEIAIYGRALFPQEVLNYYLTARSRMPWL